VNDNIAHATTTRGDKTDIVNLTPHPIDLHMDGDVITLGPVKSPPRLPERSETNESLLITGRSLPLRTIRYADDPIDLPPAKPHRLLIVARVIAEQCSDRADLVVPTDLVRDGDGRVIGCRALARIGR